MTEIDLQENLRLLLIAAIVLTSIGTLLYTFHRTKAAVLPKPKYGWPALLCGSALCVALSIALFQTDTKIIDRQVSEIMSLQNSIALSELKAKGPLADNKLTILSTAIRPFAGTAYDVSATSCADGNVVMKLNMALAAGQWKFVGATPPATAPRADVVRIQYSRASSLQPAVDTLTAAMNTIGLTATTEPTDADLTDVSQNAIHISIGPKPQ